MSGAFGEPVEGEGVKAFHSRSEGSRDLRRSRRRASHVVSFELPFGTATRLQGQIERRHERQGSADRLERAMARVMTENNRPTGIVEPKAPKGWSRVLSEFRIQLPGDLVLLSRTLVTLDGTLGLISPGMSIASAAMDLPTTTLDAALNWRTMLRDELPRGSRDSAGCRIASIAS